MTFQEAQQIISWMKKENVQQFEYEGLKVAFNNLAFVDNAAKIEKRSAKVNGRETRKLTPEEETEALLYAST